MNPAAFREFTAALTANLATDDRVIGVVALGSTADNDRSPDEWSDHDIWVVTHNGSASAFRDDQRWLPRHADIVMSYAETVHGRGVLYADGHLVEYAVFDDDELEIVKTNEYAVLHDTGGITARMDAIAVSTAHEAATASENASDQAGALFAQLVIGLNRLGRGEVLSANQMIRGRAAHTLCTLIARSVDSDNPELLDHLDPTRRVELTHPEIAGQIAHALACPLAECAARFLDIIERLEAISAPTACLTAVRKVLQNARR